MRKIIASVLYICMLMVQVSCSSQDNADCATGELGTLHEPEFGGIYIESSVSEFNALGFEYGDSVDVTFSNGYEFKDIPYYNGFYSDMGEPLLIAYPGYEYIKLAYNYGDDAYVVAGLDENDTARIVLSERGKYFDVQKARDIHYKDDRSLYPSDEVFANFRSCNFGELGSDILYRSASPADDQHNRAHYADLLMKKAGIRYVLDLADSKEKIEGYMSAGDYDSPYFKSLYEEGNVGLLALTANYLTDDFRAKLCAGLIEMSEHDGPYLVHCTEGKDRTGFVIVLLEALMGASYDEIVEDYMITYFNYYGIAKFNDPERYELIRSKNIEDMFKAIVVDDGVDYTVTDLVPYATEYLKSAGMDEQQIEALKSRLAGK